jgi:hypothetical protein
VGSFAFPFLLFGCTFAAGTSGSTAIGVADLRTGLKFEDGASDIGESPPNALITEQSRVYGCLNVIKRVYRCMYDRVACCTHSVDYLIKAGYPIFTSTW